MPELPVAASLRIAQVSTVGVPVGPETGAVGSVEGLVWTLTNELILLGHDVTVFGVDGSQAAGRVVASLPGPYGQHGSPGDWEVCEWMNICRALELADEFDVIHTHAYLWSLPLDSLSRAAMVHSLHITADSDHAALRRAYPKAPVVAPSHAQWSAYPDLAPFAVVPHGVEPARFEPTTTHRGYLCYLGRFTPDKGAAVAISVARKAEVPIVLAGPPNDYYAAEIAPHVDGNFVRYAGPVDAAARSELLGGAAALVYPVSYPEPFGLVLVEAMMCGTPVAASRVGAVPEIVEEGVTGVLANDRETLVAAVLQAVTLDRETVREHAVSRFSARLMARRYVDTYLAVLGRGR